MNDLRVTIGGDATGFERAMMQTRRATLEYESFWKDTLKKQDQQELNASIEAARRSNQARRLIRQRAESSALRERVSQERDVQAAVEKAHRDTLARRLRRERAAAREERLVRERENSFTGRLRNSAGRFFGGIGNQVAGAISFYGIQAAIRNATQYAGQLTDLSARTGVAVETLQRLDLAARENGTSLDALVGLWERVGSAREDALRDPKSGAAKAFNALGVSQDSLKSDSPEKIVRSIADAFQNSTNVEQLIAPLREIGGRGAGQMVALFRAGLDQQYQDMQVMTGEQADLLDELDDKWSTLSQTISIGLAPWIVKLIDGFTWLQDKITSFFAAIFVGMEAADAGVSNDEFIKRMGEAYRQSEAENKAEREAKTQARKERVKNRLQFGQFDPDSIEAKQEKRKAAKISEIALDDLSKSGLFAGGASLGSVNNIPERQLAATEKLLGETQRTNSILEDSL